MVLLQIHYKLNVYNFVGMHSDLTFLSYIFRGYFIPRTQCSTDVVLLYICLFFKQISLGMIKYTRLICFKHFGFIELIFDKKVLTNKLLNEMNKLRCEAEQHKISHEHCSLQAVS